MPIAAQDVLHTTNCNACLSTTEICTLYSTHVMAVLGAVQIFSGMQDAAIETACVPAIPRATVHRATLCCCVALTWADDGFMADDL